MSKARELAELIGNAGGTSEQVLSGRRNILINGDMQVWQRSDTYSGSGGIASYQTVDRWWSGADATNTTQTRNVGIVDGKRVNYISSVVTGQSYHVLLQRIEGLRYLQDQTLTFSFWSKGTTGTFNLYAQFRDGSGNVQNSINTTYTQSSNWTKHTWTFTVPSNALFDGNNTWFDISVYGGSTLELTLCQLERGSIATPFEHRSYGEELALCQRYFVSIQNSGMAYGRFGIGQIVNSVSGSFQCKFPVTMRTTPTLQTTGVPSNYGIYARAGLNIATGVPVLDGVGTTKEYGVFTVAANGMTAGDGAEIITNGTTADVFIRFDAEL